MSSAERAASGAPRRALAAGCGVGHPCRAEPPLVVVADLGKDAGKAALSHGLVEYVLDSRVAVDR
jgi:hypothetical protein